MFKGRKLIIATKHAKENVIAPILEREINVACFIANNFDSDKLGTFCGEVERRDDPITTAKNKCHLAMDLVNCDLAIASEGSFGPHPEIPFVPANEEILVFIDKTNDLEIISKEISLDTNFCGAEISTKEALDAFTKRARFPSHGLIIKDSKDDFTDVVKGITDYEYLNKMFKVFMERYGKAYLETDMRAMYNPTRMLVIEKAAIKLAKKLNSFCPNCNFPGFEITDFKIGLPCDQCSLPTRSTQSYSYTCKNCKYTLEDLYPNGKKTEEPLYCDYCNP